MFANWLKETTSTTGTGTLALSAVTGFPSFANALVNGQPVRYAILDSTGAPVEAGIGHYVASNQLSRDYVEAKYVGGTLTTAGSTAANLGTDNANSPWTVIATPTAQGILAAMPRINAVTTNKYHLGGYPYYNANGTKTLTANVPIVTAFRVDFGHEISALGCKVSTAQVGSILCVGLYPVLNDGTAGNLLVCSGNLNPDATGIQVAAPTGGADVFIPPGWYYGVIASSTNPTVGAFNAGSTGDMLDVGPLGATGMVPYAFGTAPTLTSWSTLPTTLGSIGGLTSISSDFPPVVILQEP